jgi:hypothetical protein
MAATDQKILSLVAIIFVLACGVSMACKCRLQKPAVTYCLSHWSESVMNIRCLIVNSLAAHAIIEEVHENATNPAFYRQNSQA